MTDLHAALLGLERFSRSLSRSVSLTHTHSLSHSSLNRCALAAAMLSPAFRARDFASSLSLSLSLTLSLSRARSLSLTTSIRRCWVLSVSMTHITSVIEAVSESRIRPATWIRISPFVQGLRWNHLQGLRVWRHHIFHLNGFDHQVLTFEKSQLLPSFGVTPSENCVASERNGTLVGSEQTERELGRKPWHRGMKPRPKFGLDKARVWP